MIMNVLSLQEDQYNRIFLVGHNPFLTELAKKFLKENFKIDFFIFPKQFRYYMPKQIRTILE